MAVVYYVTCPACKKDYYLQRDLYQVTISKPQQKLKCPYCKKEFSREKETSANKT